MNSGSGKGYKMLIFSDGQETYKEFIACSSFWIGIIMLKLHYSCFKVYDKRSKTQMSL